MKSSEVKIFGCILIIAIILASLALVPVMCTKEKTKAEVKPADVKATVELLIPADAHIKGDPKAPITIVVFSDFECPTCARSAKEFEKILKKFPTKLRMVYRHFQAKAEHKNAVALAAAAEAAGFQGKFWQMHDVLFNHQEKLHQTETADLQNELKGLAVQADLDVPRFLKDLGADPARKLFSRDNALGTDIKLHATPSVFIIRQDKTVLDVQDVPTLQTWLEDKRNLE